MSKRILHHPQANEGESGPRYWRSLDELPATPGLAQLAQAVRVRPSFSQTLPRMS